MRIDRVLKIFILEFREISLTNILIFSLLTILSFYPLIREGYVKVGEPPMPINILSESVDRRYVDDLISKIDEVTYVDRKVFILFFNRIFIPPSFQGNGLVKFMPIFLILAIFSYIAMSFSNILRPDIYKRYMTMPITRMEYFLGKILFSLVSMSILIIVSYFVVGSIYYRMDISVLIASLLSLPGIILTASTGYIISTVSRRDIPSFLFSSGTGYITYTYIIPYLSELLTFRSTVDNVISSPLHGYMAILGFYRDFDNLGEGGLVYRVMTGSLYVNVGESITLLIIYLTLLMSISILIILFSGYIFSRVEVD